MCTQLNNKTSVRIGRETASCDMPAGYMQLLSLQSWLGCLLGDARLELQLTCCVYETEIASKNVTLTQIQHKTFVDFLYVWVIDLSLVIALLPWCVLYSLLLFLLTCISALATSLPLW